MRPNIELTQRHLPKPKVLPPKPKVLPPTPKPKLEIVPKPKPKQVLVHRRRPIVRKQPEKTEPEGKPDVKTPAASDTGAKRFGISMDGVTAAKGTGVVVPEGDTLATDPRIRRIGKGKPKGKPGFKKKFTRGERAPVAVISTMPRVVRRVAPIYPERMRDLEIEGKVILQLTIGADGSVKKIKILKSLKKELDAAAIAAAKKMRFAPAKVGGTPVTVTIPYTFTFVLD
ncbi:MAG: TonB family protein [Deltaproteobacteria bacterium]|nr:TonB family protein [Deltaproteobacteria bacterium]